MDKLEGFDSELELEEEKQTTVVAFEETKKKRKPFHYWTVGSIDYKLKLTTGWITKLENKYKTNVINLITASDIPPLSVMLTIIQAAMIPWEHNMKLEKVYELYDRWMEEGGNQGELLTQVVLPTLAVSGFFTEAQAETLMKELEENANVM